MLADVMQRATHHPETSLTVRLTREKRGLARVRDDAFTGRAWRGRGNPKLHVRAHKRDLKSFRDELK